MKARKPNPVNSAIELGFVAVALALGWFGAPWWSVVILADLMIVYWMWNRRVGLKQLIDMGAARLAAAAGISLLLIVVVLGGAFVLGRVFSGAYQ